MQIFLHFFGLTAYIWQFKAVLLQQTAKYRQLLKKNGEKIA